MTQMCRCTAQSIFWNTFKMWSFKFLKIFWDIVSRLNFLAEIGGNVLKTERENKHNCCYNATTLFLYNKQNTRIYVAYSRPNGWTDWAEIFCGHSWVAGGCYRHKIHFFQFYFFSRATPGSSASILYNYI